MTARALAGPISFMLSVALLASADNSKCYSRALGNVISGEWFPCANTALSLGGAQSCCMAGSQCGEDSLCHVPASLATGNANWYPSGCTGSTYQDPVCRLSCTTNLQTYIIYNTTSDLWNCCGESGCNGTVTGETFSAIAPSRWSAVPTTATNSYNVAATVSVPTSTPSSSSLTTSAAQSGTTDSPAPTITVTSTPTASSQGGLSTGAQVGIGVGIGVVAIVIIAAAILFFLWRRRSSQAKEASGLPEYDDATAWQEVRAKYQSSEMPDNFVVRNELDASSVPQELASEPWKAREA